MILIWLVVGVVLTSVAFFLAPAGAELWPSLNAAGMVATFYLLALVFYSMRKPFSRRARIISWILVALVAGSVVTSWRTMDATTHWQRQTLLEIRGIIGEGIMRASIPDTLLNVLHQYYEQRPPKGASLGALFRGLYPAAKEGQRWTVTSPDESPPFIFVGRIDENEIVLIGQETFLKGRDPQFSNYDGRKGMKQHRAILTEKGVTYESEN